MIGEEKNGILCNRKNLKLWKYIYTSNMVLFSEDGKITKYDSVDHIIDSFCRVRYVYYKKRKKYFLDKLDKDIKFIGNKLRFLRDVMNGDIKLFDDKSKKRKSRKVSDIIEELIDKGYDKEDNRDHTEEEKGGNNEDKDERSGYAYLLRLQFRSITEENIDKLDNDIQSKKREREKLFNTTEKRLWINDLDEFEKSYNKWLISMEKK